MFCIFIASFPFSVFLFFLVLKKTFPAAHDPCGWKKKTPPAPKWKCRRSCLSLFPFPVPGLGDRAVPLGCCTGDRGTPLALKTKLVGELWEQSGTTGTPVPLRVLVWGQVLLSLKHQHKKLLTVHDEGFPGEHCASAFRVSVLFKPQIRSNRCPK